jgi:hypothetical protein
MLEINEFGHKIELFYNNKISITQVSDLISVSIDKSDSICLSLLKPNFSSTAVSIISDDVFNGTFHLENGMKISGVNSLLIQEKYLDWEANILTKSYITFKIPADRTDNRSGVAPFNPYFFAVINKLARTIRGFDLVGFGQYLSSEELNFVHQYCSFHPELRNFIFSKVGINNGNRVQIPCKVFELFVESALAHVDGYRDKIRFSTMFQSRGLTDDLEPFTSKFLMEYEHVLDAPTIYKECFDFNYLEGSGGLLDVLNLPF